MEISGSQEDYLKIIWYMERDQIKATTKAVASRHNVKPPTVLAMFRQLTEKKLIAYDKSTGAQLSDSGDFLARKLIRKHRLIETFLEKVLQMDDYILHKEAEKLEHVISDNLMYRIDSFLGFPDQDPHGSPIPYWDEHLKPVNLDQIGVGHSFRIQQLDLADNLNEYFEQRDLNKGTTWTVQEITPDQSAYMLTNGKVFLALSRSMVSRIKVIPHY